MGILSFFSKDRDAESPDMIRLVLQRDLEIHADCIELMQTTVNTDIFFSRYVLWLKTEERILERVNKNNPRRWHREFPQIGYFNSNESVRSKYQIDFIRRMFHLGRENELRNAIVKYVGEMTKQAVSYFENNVAPLSDPIDPEKEYIFCSVVFPGKTDLYDYLTDDESIKPMDNVIVPIGSKCEEKEARVIRVIRCTADSAPYPIEKVKYIIRKDEN